MVTEVSELPLEQVECKVVHKVMKSEIMEMCCILILLVLLVFAFIKSLDCGIKICDFTVGKFNLTSKHQIYLV